MGAGTVTGVVTDAVLDAMVDRCFRTSSPAIVPCAPVSRGNLCAFDYLFARREPPSTSGT
jgi:hypothetical protein